MPLGSGQNVRLKSPRSSLTLLVLAVDYLCLGTIAAVTVLGVPNAVLVLPADFFRLATDLLLRCHDAGRLQGIGMRGERLGIDVTETIGPATIMLDDLVDNLGHASHVLSFARRAGNAPAHQVLRKCRWRREVPVRGEI
ncbi:protein of unknown function [Pseudorhizobium banfieldiae]|uniref:Uncharacterized protein n=1 Tax=Pseudorhizobium banfieldiae TaxID=1125847 RepID=L0NGS2_9HYPH|nr:protein of unknown function [Pseudorhizobium banfieldiae]